MKTMYSFIAKIFLVFSVFCTVAVYGQPLVVSETIEHTIYGESTGSITLSATSGSSITYLWSTASTSNDITGLDVGDYSVTVTAGTDTFIQTYTIQYYITWNLFSNVNETVSHELICTNNVTWETALENYAYGQNVLKADSHGIINYHFEQGKPFSGLLGIIDNRFEDGSWGIGLIVLSDSFETLGPGVYFFMGESNLYLGTFDTSQDNRISIRLESDSGFITKNGVVLFAADYGGVKPDLFPMVIPFKSTSRIAYATCNYYSLRLVATSEVTQLSCPGDNGSIDVTVTGGFTPYSYLWSNSATTASINSLGVGIYTLTVTDDIGDELILTYDLAYPVEWDTLINFELHEDGGLISIAPQPDYAIGANSLTVTQDGSVTFEIAEGGGFAGAIGLIDNLNLDETNIEANLVLIEDSSMYLVGKSIEEEYLGGYTPGLPYRIRIELIDDTVKVYKQELWDGGATTNVRAVSPRQHDVFPLVFGFEEGVELASVRTNFACGNLRAKAEMFPAEDIGSTGSIYLTAKGGMPPYTYAWSNSATTASITNIPPGDYRVTITDDNSTTVSKHVFLGAYAYWDELVQMIETPEHVVHTDDVEAGLPLGHALGYNQLDMDSDGTIMFEFGSGDDFGGIIGLIPYPYHDDTSGSYVWLAMLPDTNDEGHEVFIVHNIDEGDLEYIGYAAKGVSQTLRIRVGEDSATVWKNELASITFPVERNRNLRPVIIPFIEESYVPRTLVDFGCVRPEAPFAPASQSICSDTAYVFTWDSIQVGAGGDSIEWSLHKDFDSSIVIASGGSIQITVEPYEKDTIWVRSITSGTRCVSQAVLTYGKVNGNPYNPIFVSGDTLLFAGDSTTFIATAEHSSFVHYTVTEGAAQIDSLSGKVTYVTSNFTVRATSIGEDGCGSSFTDVNVVVNKNPLEYFLQMPLYFEKNLGQWNDSIKYKAGNGTANIYFLDKEMLFTQTRIRYALDTSSALGANIFPKDDTLDLAVWKQRLKNVSDSSVLTDSAIRSEYYNYIIGNDTADYVNNVPVYGQIQYTNVYPHTDLKYYSTSKDELEYDFVIHPGGSIDDIVFELSGVSIVRIDSAGTLVLQTPFGEIQESAPVSYQSIDTDIISVDIRYRIINDTTFGFIANEVYDGGYDLVIDPIALRWNSWFANRPDEHVSREMAVVNTGNSSVDGIYVTGFTTGGPGAVGTGIPGVGVYQTIGGNGVLERDAFVLKAKLDGTGWNYYTYLCGKFEDRAYGITVLNDGSACVTGTTASKLTFPHGTAAVGPGPNGGGSNFDAFVTRLTPTGALNFSYLVGGSGNDEGISITNGASNRLVAIGISGSYSTTSCPQNFPAVNLSGFGCFEGWIVHLDNAGAVISNYPRLIQPGSDVFPYAVKHYNSNYYIAGSCKPNLSTVNTFTSTAYSGTEEFTQMFISRDNGAGAITHLAKFRSNSFDNIGYDLVLDNSGDIYVLGVGGSATDYFAGSSITPFKATPLTDNNAFLVKLNNSCSSIQYLTYLGPDFGLEHDYASPFWGDLNLDIDQNETVYALLSVFTDNGVSGLSCAFDLGLSTLYLAVIKENNTSLTLSDQTYIGRWSDGLWNDGNTNGTHFQNLGSPCDIKASNGRIYLSYCSPNGFIYSNPSGVAVYESQRPSTAPGLYNLVLTVLDDWATQDKCITNGSGISIGGAPLYSGTAAYSWTPTTGLSCSSCANPTASPTQTTTYTVSVTDGGNCLGTSSVTVFVIPSVSISATGGSGTPCTATLLTATNVDGATYTWSNGSGILLTGIGENELNATSTGNYSLTVSYSEACFVTASVSVSESQFCCEGGEWNGKELSFINVAISDVIAFLNITPNNGQYIFNFGTTPISFNGSLTIDENVFFSSCDHIRFGPGAKVTVNGGKTLGILNSTLYACDKMWAGIDVTGGSTPGRVSIVRSQIRDALYAVRLHNSSQFTSQRTVYRNNFVGIYYDEPGTNFLPNVFNIPPAPFQQLNSLVGNTFEGTQFLLPAYTGMTTGAYQPPVSQVSTTARWSWAGIHVVRQWSMNVGAGSSTFDRNYFKNMANGIVADACDLTVVNSRFENILPYGYTGAFDALELQGNGILATNWNAPRIRFTPRLSYYYPHILYEKGLGKSSATATFDNCQRGIVSDRLQVRDIWANYMNGPVATARNGIKIRNSNNTFNSGVVSVRENRIDYGGIGIHMLFNAPVTSTKVFQNDITITATPTSGQTIDGVGIAVHGNMTQWAYKPKYFDNKVYLTGDAFAGMLFYTDRGFECYANEVYLTSPSENLLGIVMAGCSEFEDRLNYVNSTVTGSAITQNATVGGTPIGMLYFFNSGGTANTVHDCNSIENIWTGMELLGPNAFNTLLIGNHFNKNSSGVTNRMNDGLLLASTTLADQYWAGNLWYGNGSQPYNSSNTTYTGFWLNNQSNTRFYTSETTSGNPLRPLNVFQNPTSGISFSYLAGSEYECLTSDPPNPGTNNGHLTAVDLDVVNSTLEFGAHEDALIYSNEEIVFRKLKCNPSLLDSSSAADSFYNARLNTPMDVFERIDSVMNAAYHVDSATLATWAGRMIKVDSLILMKNDIDSIRADTTLSESAVADLTLEIEELHSIIDSIQSIFDTTFLDKLDTSIAYSLQLNTAVTTTNTIQANSKAVNAIFLSKLGSDSVTYDSAQLATLYDIAFQCPLEGGSAVFRARSLLALVIDTGYIDQDLCAVSYKTQDADWQPPLEDQIIDSAIVSFRLYPNPAEDYTIIESNKAVSNSVSLKVTDAIGRVIVTTSPDFSGKKYYLNTSQLSSGLYFVTLHSEGKKLFEAKVSVL